MELYESQPRSPKTLPKRHRDTYVPVAVQVQIPEGKLRRRGLGRWQMFSDIILSFPIVQRAFFVEQQEDVTSDLVGVVDVFSVRCPVSPAVLGKDRRGIRFTGNVN